MRPLAALERHRSGTFAALVAATCLLMLLAAAAALMLHGAARSLQRDSTARLIVQVTDADTALRDRTVDEVVQRLARTGHDVRPLPMAQAEALLAPYIGAMHVADLPIPALIEVHDLPPERVRAALRDLGGVQVTEVGGELGPLLKLIAAFRSAAMAVMLVAIGTTGLIATLAARAALAREAATIDIVHALGATDRQITRLLTGRIAREALAGSLLGGGAGVVLILLLARKLAATGIGAVSHLAPDSWAVILLAPLLLAALAILAAQVTLATMLRRAA